MTPLDACTLQLLLIYTRAATRERGIHLYERVPGIVLQNRAAHRSERRFVRQIARKPQPPVELLIVHFSRCTTEPTGDDDAPGDSPACEVDPRVVHGRQSHPVRNAIIECQLITEPPRTDDAPSGSRPAAGNMRAWMRLGCGGAHAPVARSTRCTVDSNVKSSSAPPSRSTCPAALSLSSTATAAAPRILPHDNAGRSTNAPCTEEESISTLRPLGPAIVLPPRTTRVPLTAQHAWL
jgi:hypothetical protein